MRISAVLRGAFILFAAVHVLGLLTHRPLLPWAGTYALAMLTAYAWWRAARRPTPAQARGWRPAVLGLAALTGVAALVDLRGGGAGWPGLLLMPTGGALWGAVEDVLLSGAVAGLAVAALRATGLPRSRWTRVAVAAPTLLVAALAAAGLWQVLGSGRYGWSRASATVLTGPALPLAGAAIVGALAAGAAWSAGRRRQPPGARLVGRGWLARGSPPWPCSRSVACSACRRSIPGHRWATGNVALYQIHQYAVDDPTLLLGHRGSWTRTPFSSPGCGTGATPTKPAPIAVWTGAPRLGSTLTADGEQTGLSLGELFSGDIWTGRTAWLSAAEALIAAFLLVGVVAAGRAPDET